MYLWYTKCTPNIVKLYFTSKELGTIFTYKLEFKGPLLKIGPETPLIVSRTKIDVYYVEHTRARSFIVIITTMIAGIYIIII